MEKCIIVAIADNNAIGRDNALLWHISEDLKFFKRTTSGCPVIMGRKTFESIGRPLPKRTNIVISRGFDAPDGVIVVGSLQEAYETAASAIHSVVSPMSSIPDVVSIIPDVVSSIPDVVSSIPDVVSSIPDVMSSEVETSPSRCFIMGGGQIYAQAMHDADMLIITHVHTVIEDADTFFPPVDPSVWKVIERSEMQHDDETGYDFEFVTYARVADK